MADDFKNEVCPVEKAGSLDGFLRRLIHNPQRILKPYLKKGMTVLDLGCGPGFFTLEMARMLSGEGKVVAADLQKGMLDIVDNKIRGTKLESMIILHLCQKDFIGLLEKVDFVFAFYVVHEIPNQEYLFKELKELLNPGGLLFVAEPKGHVSQKAFNKMTQNILNVGFDILKRPKVFYSRSLLLRKKE